VNLDIGEFKRLLRIGHGRAILFLWDVEDDSPYRDAILDACLHNQAVDPLSDVRGNYMDDVIIATGNPEVYEPPIIEALLNLPDTANEYDVHQLYHLVWLFTLRGNIQARETIYKRAAINIAQADFVGAYQVVRMDGLDGYGFAAEQIGRYLGAGGVLDGDLDKDKIDNRLIELLEERYGKLDFLAMLAQSHEGNAAVTTYVERVLVLRNHPRERRSDPDPRHWDYAQLQEKFQEGLHYPRLTFKAWGRKCTEGDLMLAATDLVTQTDPIKLAVYLSIFHDRQFPLDPSLLIPFTQHIDVKVKASAFRALEQIKHPLVRALALDLIQAGIDTGDAVSLLEANFQPNDWSLIENLIVQPIDDLRQQHWLQISARQVVNAYPGPENVRTLQNLYEFGPCAFCRTGVVELLMQNNALSKTMQSECEYDAESDTRRLIQGESDLDEPE
jgi:hypothetical protein